MPKKKDKDIESVVSEEFTVEEPSNEEENKEPEESASKPEEKKGKKGKKTKKDEDKDKDVVDMSSMCWGMGTNIIPTGIHAVDIILGGGYEPGDWIELTGEWGTGKSTLVLDICRRAFLEGKKIAYLDVENGVKASILNNFKIDINEVGHTIGKDRFLLISPQNFGELETVFENIVSDKENKRYDIIVIDSLSNVSQFDETLSIKSKDIALRARQEGIFFTIFKSMLRKYKITVFVVNQVTQKFEKKGMNFVCTKDSTGGNKSKHNFDIRLWLDKGMVLRHKEGTILGSTVGEKGARNDDKTIFGCISKLKATKNRGERPEIPVDLHVLFGRGISNPMFVDSVLCYHEYYTVNTGGWKFGYIPELPCLSEKSGKRVIDRQNIVLEHEAEIIQFLKDNNKWKLTYGVVDDDSEE